MSNGEARYEYQTFGLPTGTVRGALSVMICSFFWILLLTPWDPPMKAPLGHFFLLTLVFLAFASHPIQEIRESAFLPWVMRLIFVGGSVAVVFYVGIKHPGRLGEQLTPSADQISQWPVLLGCLGGGFGVALFLRSVLGRDSVIFQSIRAWIGVLAFLLLLGETVFQFAILPNMSDKPGSGAMQVWEGLLIAVTAGYFGSRA